MRVELVQNRGTPVPAVLQEGLSDADAITYCASLLRVFGAPVVYGEHTDSGLALKVPGLPFSLVCRGLHLKDSKTIGMTALVPDILE